MYKVASPPPVGEENQVGKKGRKKGGREDKGEKGKAKRRRKREG